LSGSKCPIVLHETGREVHDLKRSGGSIKPGFQHVRVLKVRLPATLSVRRTHQKSAALRGVKERGEDRFRVEARQTTPHHFAGAFHERRKLTISNNTEVFQAHPDKVADLG
jgi:hypothetical protein